MFRKMERNPWLLLIYRYSFLNLPPMARPHPPGSRTPEATKFEPRYGSQGHSDRATGKSTLRKRQPVATESGGIAWRFQWDQEEGSGRGDVWLTLEDGIPGLGYVVNCHG